MFSPIHNAAFDGDIIKLKQLLENLSKSLLKK